jgi:hypothetical protein
VPTSRRAPGLDGERQSALSALDLPGLGDTRDSTVTSPAVAALVTALEGMPRAIELAAARLRSLSPAQMLLRLQPAMQGQAGSALELLARTGPCAGHDPRHASMQAVDLALQAGTRAMGELQIVTCRVDCISYKAGRSVFGAARRGTTPTSASASIASASADGDDTGTAAPMSPSCTAHSLASAV